MVSVRSLICALMLAAAAIAAPRAAHADEVIRWNQVATAATAAAGVNPQIESRVLAILHAAMHDAVNAVERRYEPYCASTLEAAGTSPEAAAASAAHVVLSTLLPGTRPVFDAALADALRAVPDGEAQDLGVAAGRQAADLVLAARANDRADAHVWSAPGADPGEYRPTPPIYEPAAMPHWGRVEPFALASASQFRPQPPPALASDAYATDVAEVRALGGASSRARTFEQSTIAKFWYESSTQGWNRIAREVSASRRLGLWENARLFALVNIAMADGFIAGVDATYYFNVWRPVTAIHDAAVDGNASTVADDDWQALLETPPAPDYPSTHTVVGAAAATVLARFVGSDLVGFSMTSGAPYAGLTRHFWSFSDAARESGAARILAGADFRSAITAGYALGESVGSWVFDRVLQPSPAAATASNATR